MMRAATGWPAAFVWLAVIVHFWGSGSVTFETIRDLVAIWQK
jgi:hypothetical protein